MKGFLKVSQLVSITQIRGRTDTHRAEPCSKELYGIGPRLGSTHNAEIRIS
jgi:hypothetical protein